MPQSFKIYCGDFLNCKYVIKTTLQVDLSPTENGEKTSNGII